MLRLGVVGSVLCDHTVAAPGNGGATSVGPNPTRCGAPGSGASLVPSALKRACLNIRSQLAGILAPTVAV